MLKISWKFPISLYFFVLYPNNNFYLYDSELNS
jgi:hypothetical protein